MFDELPVGATQAANAAEQMPPLPIAGVLAPSPPPSPEDARAIEAVFAAQERESDEVAALFGLWTGTLLLNDLAKETFCRPTGERERVQPKRNDEDKD
jgi:hypothetical protein